MSRTTEELVQGLLMQDYDQKRLPSLEPFIDTASMIVDRIMTVTASDTSTLSAGEQEMIERWLAAHGYCMVDQPYAMRKTGQSSGIFQGKTGMMLEATKYGQMALTLDWTGTLRSLNDNFKIQFAWLGKDWLDKQSWEQRNGTFIE